ncbi:MAG: SWF/SNF helicase family protein [bacterium]|nr:SWF/SNF helicase family protein [bacterium]
MTRRLDGNRAPCHGAGSAKLEALFEQVNEILDEGHKVLLFSQFVKLLA